MTPNRREFLAMLGTAAATDMVATSANAASTEPRSVPAEHGTAGELCFMSGRELVRLIRTREVSAHEVMLAHLRQIERVNPKVNAIVAKLDDARCLALADLRAGKPAAQIGDVFLDRSGEIYRRIT